MDLFDDNPYYDQAIPQPIFTPKFQVEEKIYHRTVNPNWNNLNPISAQLFVNRSPVHEIEIQQQQNGLFEVYTTEYNLQDYSQLPLIKQFRKQKKIKLELTAFFNQTQYNAICEQLEQNFDLDLISQRGLNFSIHKRDYISNISIYGYFSSEKNLKKITNQIALNYLPYKIIVAHNLTNMEIEFNGSYNTIEITDQKQQQYQILYLKQGEEELSQQLMSFLKVIRDNLDDGGCFLMQFKDISSSAVTQYLYLFQRIFVTITLFNNDNLDYYVNIGCYGYQKRESYQLLNKVIESENQTFNFFRLKDLVQDQNFEPYIVKFYKELLQKRSQQLKLIEQLKNTEFSNYEDYLNCCEKLRTEYQEKQEEIKTKKARQRTNDGHYKSDNYHNSHHHHSGNSPQVLNKRQEIVEVQTHFEHFEFRRPIQTKPIPNKELDKKKLEEQKQKQRELEIEQLRKLSEPAKKKGKQTQQVNKKNRK